MAVKHGTGNGRSSRLRIFLPATPWQWHIIRRTRGFGMLRQPRKTAGIASVSALRIKRCRIKAARSTRKQRVI